MSEYNYGQNPGHINDAPEEPSYGSYYEDAEMGYQTNDYTYDHTGYDQTKEYGQDGSIDTAAADAENPLQSGMQRGLHARHIQMIALGGTIGTGIFLASGGNVASAGPAGALIAYGIIGFMVFCIVTCLGEMATFLPVSGSFNHYAGRFIDPALGFSLGWNYWFSWAVTIATELSAMGSILGFWSPAAMNVGISYAFLVFVFGLNMLGVRVYGEVEYWFCIIKILMVIVFIIVAIVYNTGAVGSNGYLGGTFFRDPGPFVGGAAGTISVLLTAGFSFQGTELVGITAGETKNPRKAVPRAIRNTFFRILLFYMLVILMIGLDIPSSDPNLIPSESDPQYSPFTLVFIRSGISGGAHVINAVVFIAVLSACVSATYASSRIVMALAREGKAPAILGRIDKRGVPVLALIFSCLAGAALLGLGQIAQGAAFQWLVNVTGVAGFISWAGIGGAHYRFRRAYVKQGRDLNDLPYHALWYPFSGLFSLVLCTAIILGQGWYTFSPFVAVSFVGSYLGLVPFVLCYVGYKIVKRSKVVPLMECDFDTGRVERPLVEQEKVGIFRRIFNIIA